MWTSWFWHSHEYLGTTSKLTCKRRGGGRGGHYISLVNKFKSLTTIVFGLIYKLMYFTFKKMNIFFPSFLIILQSGMSFDMLITLKSNHFPTDI